MEKKLKTGDFIIPEEKNKPLILMLFNQFESNVENVYFAFKDNYIHFRYKSSNILKIEIEDINLKNKLENIKQILIIEINEEDGDIQKMYITNKKPA
jgi:hypothetical protein